jgi:hypothetical protein
VSVPLQSEFVAIDAETWLRAWLLPLTASLAHPSGDPATIGSKLWTAGLPKPYRAVRRLAGPRTVDTDYPVMRVHTFGTNYDQAADEGNRTDSRVQLLVEYPGWNTTLPSGLVVHCEWAEIPAAAHEEEYGAESVVTRFVSEYRFGLSLRRG